MNDDLADVAWAIVPKSDQLNADTLLAGPLDVTITGTSAYSDDKGGRRIEVRLQDRLPWRPCKSMARVLVAAWGADSRAWVGRRVRLYCDPNVVFGGQKVGGIRVSHLSDIPGPMDLSLTVTKGKRAPWKVLPLPAEQRAAQERRPAQERPTADLGLVLADAELSEVDVDRWLSSQGKPSLAARNDGQRAVLAGHLATHPEALDAIRALVPVVENAFHGEFDEE